MVPFHILSYRRHNIVFAAINGNINKSEALMEQNTENTAFDCGYMKGTLPSCAPLSVPFVPFQGMNQQKYDSAKALSRGTLFPGLDLPWKNVVPGAADTSTPIGELSALGFVINELGLYLDTHRSDTEALKLYLDYVELYKKGAAKYIELYGPLFQTDVTKNGYTWLDNPWPWDVTERRAR